MQNKQRILVVFTGGTIGSATNDGVINISAQSQYDLLNRFRESWTGETIDFETIEPLWILSENANPHDWENLIESILSIDISNYTGIIVTHGTDTLAYTAAALSFGLSGISVPVVLVSGNKPLSAADGNGLSNFINAVSLIIQTDLTGVYVIYRNPDGVSRIHLGTRLTQALPFIHSFGSAKNSEIGCFDNTGRIEFTPGSTPSPEELAIPGLKPENLAPKFCADIIYIRPYPGLNYDLYNFSETRPRAIVHDLYHSATACTESSFPAYSFIDFIRRCQKESIDIYITPVCRNQSIYQTASEILQTGVTPVFDMSVEATMVKLMLLYGNFSNSDTVRQMVNSCNIFHEIIG